MTTRKFLEVFGLASLRDLPDLERLKAEGLMHGGQGEDGLESALGLVDVDDRTLQEDAELDDAGSL